MRKRLIVVSDSHGDADGLKAALEQAMRGGSVNAVVFLGDGMRDYESLLPALQAQRIDCYAVKATTTGPLRRRQRSCFPSMACVFLPAMATRGR